MAATYLVVNLGYLIARGLLPAFNRLIAGSQGRKLRFQLSAQHAQLCFSVVKLLLRAGSASHEIAQAVNFNPGTLYLPPGGGYLFGHIGTLVKQGRLAGHEPGPFQAERHRINQPHLLLHPECIAFLHIQTTEPAARFG